MQLLYLLEGIRSPFLNALMCAVTHLGDELFFIAFAVTLYWCVSKKWGLYVLLVCFAGSILNQFLKILCRVPRPWVRDPAFSIVESARDAAAGYSFPSGHTANAASLLGGCARVTRSRRLRALCVVLILLVAVSRMYLGVHYPTDVLFSLAASAALIFAMYPLVSGTQNCARRIGVLALVLTALSACFALWLTLHTWPAEIDTGNLASARKNACLLTGCGLGMLLGLWLDRRHLHFDVRAPLWAQGLKVILGLALLLGLKSGLKLLLPSSLWCYGLRYFCVSVFATCVWPLSFPWFARGCKWRRT